MGIPSHGFNDITLNKTAVLQVSGMSGMLGMPCTYRGIRFVIQLSLWSLDSLQNSCYQASD